MNRDAARKIMFRMSQSVLAHAKQSEFVKEGETFFTVEMIQSEKRLREVEILAQLTITAAPSPGTNHGLRGEIQWWMDSTCVASDRIERQIAALL